MRPITGRRCRSTRRCSPGPTAHGQARPALSEGRQAWQARRSGRGRGLAAAHGLPVRCVLVREAGSTKPYDLALFTLDTACDATGIVERYATRWSIEPTNAAGKQHMGVGQARNRLPKAVQRTVPFGMLIQSLVIVWYAVSGYHPDDVVLRRQAEPWYDAKTEPSFEDMLIKLRKTLIAARFSAVRPGQTDPDILQDYALACAAAAT